MSGLPDIVAPAARQGRRSRDALAVLASVLLAHGRPQDAAKLLAAVALMPGDAAWARRARCQALLMAGENDAAAEEARTLLSAAMTDQSRVAVLHVLARAEWRRGRAAAARAVFREALDLSRASVVAR
jgi:Flp pilus assembly protein TadD